MATDDDDEELLQPKRRTNKKALASTKHKNSAPRSSVPMTSFVSARMLAQEDDEDSDNDALDKLVAKHTQGDSIKPSKPSKAQKKAIPKQIPTKPAAMNWLLDSDSDESDPPPKPQPRNTVAEQNVPIDLTETEESDVELIEEVQISPPKSRPTVSNVNRRLVAKDVNTSSPEASFLLEKPAKRRVLPPPPADDSLELSSPVIRRLRRKGDEGDRRLMPPPRAPGAATADTNSKARGSGVKYSVLDKNEFLEMEAQHSGDEVDAGSSDSDGIAHSSDIEWLVDTSGTQAPSGYEQSVIYRQSLLTQAPNNAAPVFASRPVKTGFLGRGRASIGEPRRYGATGSSPMRSSDIDNYSLGSFVVEDDDQILEASSQDDDL